MLSKSAPSPHRPPHIYTDNSYYFVTASTLNRAHLLTPITHKPYLQERLLTLTTDYGFNLIAWVIMNNHYHVMLHIGDSKNIPRFLSICTDKPQPISINGINNRVGRFGTAIGIVVFGMSEIIGHVSTISTTILSNMTMFNG